MEELQRFVMDDIIESIRINEDVGNISHNDALDLIDLTTKLYMKIYSKYKELEEFTVRLYDQSMELATDKYEKTVDELEEELELTRDKYEKTVKELEQIKLRLKELEQK